MVEELSGKHFELPVHRKLPWYFYSNARHIKEIIKEYNIDLVDVHSRAPAWGCYLACRESKTPLITSFHGDYGTKWGKKLYNKVMTFGDRIIAVSSYIKNHIIEEYKVDPEKIEIVHRGVDVNYFDPAKVNKQKVEIFHNLTFGYPRPIILMPGRFTRWKGHLLLLEALKLVKQDFICIFLGKEENSTQYLTEIKNQIAKHRLEEKIFLMAPTRDMREAYAAADIVVSASIRPEAFGRVAAEGQAMEKMVLATKLGGSLESIIDGQTAIITELNPHSMAEKLELLLSLSPEEREKLGKRARQHIIDNFSLEKMQNHTIKIYQKLKDSYYV